MNSVNSAKALLTSPNVVCKCGCKIFVPGFLLKKVSALVSPTGKEEIVDLPIYVCSKCGEIPEEFKSKPNFKQIMGEE